LITFAETYEQKYVNENNMSLYFVYLCSLTGNSWCNKSCLRFASLVCGLVKLLLSAWRRILWKFLHVSD